MKKATILLSSALLVWASSAMAYEPTADEAYYYAVTEDAMDEIQAAPKGATERIEKVLTRLEEEITKYPNSAPLETMMGRALIIRDCALNGNNCSVRAKGHLTRAVHLDPKFVLAHVLLAHDAMNGGCLPCADPHIRTAESLAPNDPRVLEVRGRYLQLSGNGGEAEDYYVRALRQFKTEKKKWQTYTWLSTIYEERENYQEAEWALKQALAAEPEGAWSLGNLGVFYITVRGDYGKAIPLLRDAVSVMSYGYARESLMLALYERWGDAYLRKADKPTLKADWAAAQAESPDLQDAFLVSAHYLGGGKAARALLEAGKVPLGVLRERYVNGRTPLLMAAYNDKTRLEEFLIDRGADPDARDEDGVPVAHVVAMYGNLQVMKALAAKNANFGAVTPDNRETTLMWLEKQAVPPKDRIEVARVLVAHGVRVDAQTSRGATALTYAALRNDPLMMKFLLSRGANPSGAPGSKFPPLIFPVYNHRLDLTKILLDAGANPSVEYEGMDLAEYADKHGAPEIAQLLRNAKGEKGDR